MVSVAKQVEFEGLLLDTELVRNVGNINSRKVWLSGNRAKRGEFRAVELDEIVIFHMTIVKGFEDFGLIFENVVGFFVAEEAEVFHFFLL